MSGTKPTVLVTAIGGGGHGEQILKALNLSGNYHVIGADADPFSPQFSNVMTGFRLPRADDRGYMGAVLDACVRFDVAAVFHGCEPDLRTLSENRTELERSGVLFPANPQTVIDIGMDKAKTMAFLETHGFTVPRTVALGAHTDLSTIDWFPVVIKPRSASGGSKDVYIAQDARDIELVREYLSAQESSELIVQEYVGTPDAEFTVGVLHDLNGEYLNSIAIRRSLTGQLNVRTSAPNRTGRTDLGDRLVISSGVSHGHVGRYPEVTEPCAALASALGATGAINVQCRLVNDRVYVFEINPRFSGTTSIRAMMGYNEPDVLLRTHLLGEAIQPDFDYRSGWVMRSLIETEVSSPVPWWYEVS